MQYKPTTSRSRRQLFDGTSLRMPLAEREQLDVLAARVDRSRCSLIRLAIRRLLAEERAGLLKLEQL